MLVSSTYTPIVATLGYVFSPCQSKVLLIHRDKRTSDPHFGKYNGLGGKLNPDEDVASCMKREIREEAGIECHALTMLGTISWPGFGKNGEDWLGFIFVVDAFQGTPKSENDEGSLHWVAVGDVEQLNLWEGDRYFLPLVFADQRRPFHGVMPYKNGRPTSWQVTVL